VLRIDRKEKRLTRLQQTTLMEAAHWERQIQGMIIEHSDPFCEELGEPLWIVGQEVRPSESLPDRIDILAIDEDGSAVIIELKRGSHKLQLLQAVSYSGMIARWAPDQFVDTLAQNYRQSLADARADIEEHIGPDLATLNRSQRIILLAEDFDPALLVGAEWLHENFGVDIRCYRMSLSQEDNQEYLTCICIYPPMEIASLTRGGKVKKPDNNSGAWTDWDAALQGIENQSVVEFFRKELSHEHEGRLRYRELVYRIGDKRRFFASCRKKYVYTWQDGRFGGDEDFWRKRLSNPGSVVHVKKDHSGLRFHLITRR
jgi:hypothetical protein